MADFRFAKVMDGSYRVTICGDPLYFSPEIVAQQGYDYAVDLWAFGVLLFELYEGSTPFGNSDTDETTIFRAITAYRASRLNFNKATPEARKLIASLMQYGSEDRLGYKDPAQVCSSEYFTGTVVDRYLTSTSAFEAYFALFSSLLVVRCELGGSREAGGSSYRYPAHDRSVFSLR